MSTSTPSTASGTGLPTVRNLGGPLTALNLSSDKLYAAVVGREGKLSNKSNTYCQIMIVLKIVSIQDEEVKETQNLRVGAKINLNYSSVDVKWHPSERKPFFLDIVN
jgi:hypothetical protein